MNKPVSGYLVAFALALSVGLIVLGVSGVDVSRLGRVFFALMVLGVAVGIIIGLIASLLRP